MHSSFFAPSLSGTQIKITDFPTLLINMFTPTWLTSYWGASHESCSGSFQEKKDFRKQIYSFKGPERRQRKSLPGNVLIFFTFNMMETCNDGKN